MDSLRVFEVLKQKLLEKYRQAYPYFQGNLQQFRQADIANFQELLEEEQHARVSEKWFYTHLKPSVNEKLPRIDTLNLLARFVGSDSWEAFLFAEQQAPTKQKTVSLRSALLPALLLLLLISASFLWWPAEKGRVELCFVDAIRRVPITEVPIQVALLGEDENAQWQTKDSSACLLLNTKEVEEQLICSAPYYLTDTISLSVTKPNDQQEIALRTDDYALMIHYFSNSKAADWKKRRAQLNDVFAEEAVIYHLDPEGQRGMDILNKTEFINKMTIPLNSLREVEVLQTIYQDGQIVELRFK